MADSYLSLINRLDDTGNVTNSTSTTYSNMPAANLLTRRLDQVHRHGSSSSRLIELSNLRGVDVVAVLGTNMPREGGSAEVRLYSGNYIWQWTDTVDLFRNYFLVLDDTLSVLDVDVRFEPASGRWTDVGRIWAGPAIHTTMSYSVDYIGRPMTLSARGYADRARPSLDADLLAGADVMAEHFDLARRLRVTLSYEELADIYTGGVVNQNSYVEFLRQALIGRDCVFVPDLTGSTATNDSVSSEPAYLGIEVQRSAVYGRVVDASFAGIDGSHARMTVTIDEVVE